MASVLIVDDDPRIRELLRRWLEPEGHALWFSEDANAALVAIGEELPAVSSETLAAASPSTSIACTTANSSMRSESRSARSRPAMKLPIVSAASIICARRTRSSARILHTPGAHHLVAKMTGEIERGSEVDGPATQKG